MSHNDAEKEVDLEEQRLRLNINKHILKIKINTIVYCGVLMISILLGQSTTYFRKICTVIQQLSLSVGPG